MSVIVKLEQYELINAAMAGVQRRISSLLEGDNDYQYSPESPWAIDINGAGGEAAVAKELNIYWNASVRTFKRPDVGKFQVRATEYSTGRLPVRKGDNPEEMFILVIAQAPLYKIVGWKLGKDAMQPQHKWRNNWGVLQENLEPWQSFLDKLKEDIW